MLDDAPILTIRKKFPRPSKAQVNAIKGAPTGFVADALGGRAALSGVIKPIDPAMASFCGVAVTCHTGPADNLAVFGAMEMAEAGDVIVVATDGFMPTAVIGDLVLGMMKNRGCVAAVTDGCVRDIPGLVGVGLPCFAAGVTPDSPARNGPGTAGLAVTLAGGTVAAGDILVGDLDGVVVIPHARIDDVIAALPELRKAEAAMEEKVKAGLQLPDFAKELLASDRVKIVD